jgi:8-amino-3,8-dideoxy-alpha-D-manno-octulosonate transaminase
MPTSSTETTKLARDGGEPHITETLPGTLHGVLQIGDAEIEAVTKVMRRGTIWRFLNDESISESIALERRYAEMIGTEYALALGGGGTSALICALVGAGIGSGDEVIVPGYTYIATAAACLSVGAIPILAEVDESLTLDPADVEAKITPYTRAVIPVHMRGTPCDMQPIMDVARRHDLKVIEDVAQANGGTYRGQMLGSFGDAGCFSLQHFKVITAGEGGVVTTNDHSLWQRAALKHDSAMQFWSEGGDWPSFAGENYRMDEMRAAMGLVQVERMPAILEKTRAAKRRLREATAELAKIQLQRLPDEDGDCGIAFAFFLPTADEAQAFSDALEAEGVKNATIYNKQIPDRHIYTAWDYVLEKRSSDHTGWPWTAAHRQIEYSTDMLPRTVELLGRCIAIGLNQDWAAHHCELVAGAIRKVHEGIYGSA